MKILLVVSSIYNTIDKFNEENFELFINYLDEICKKSDYNDVFFSICDNTCNKNVILYYLRKIERQSKNIKFGYQFLKDEYFKGIIDGSHLYENSSTKEEKIINYINIINKYYNKADLLYIDCNEIKYDKFVFLENEVYIINKDILNNLNKIKKMKLTF